MFFIEWPLTVSKQIFCWARWWAFFGMLAKALVTHSYHIEAMPETLRPTHPHTYTQKESFLYGAP